MKVVVSWLTLLGSDWTVMRKPNPLCPTHAITFNGYTLSLISASIYPLMVDYTQHFRNVKKLICVTRDSQYPKRVQCRERDKSISVIAICSCKCRSAAHTPRGRGKISRCLQL
ncbi:hypothetical protein BKA83DRAFT_2800960 [Pisolithus microcarpus]|nr:hypothetical protein BKA83DRAFT_2800960 [Pisolithus microcarpus]